MRWVGLGGQEAGRWGWHQGSGPLLPQQEEEGHLLEQCRGLDKAVVYLTKFVRQNQVSLNRVLMAEQKARWVSCQDSGPPSPLLS